MKATLWKLIHKWRDATTTESAWIARDQIDIELDEIDELRAALVERDADLLEYCDLMAAAAEMLMAVLPQCHPVQLVLSAAAGSYSLESASQPP
jgi:hypothetical protein